MDLISAIKGIIASNGKSIVESDTFVNLLNDYNAFSEESHRATSSIFKSLCQNSSVQKIITDDKFRKGKKILRYEIKAIISEITDKHGFDKDKVSDALKKLLIGCEVLSDTEEWDAVLSGPQKHSSLKISSPTGRTKKSHKVSNKRQIKNLLIRQLPSSLKIDRRIIIALLLIGLSITGGIIYKSASHTNQDSNIRTEKVRIKDISWDFYAKKGNHRGLSIIYRSSSSGYNGRQIRAITKFYKYYNGAYIPLESIDTDYSTDGWCAIVSDFYLSDGVNVIDNFIPYHALPEKFVAPQERYSIKISIEFYDLSSDAHQLIYQTEKKLHTRRLADYQSVYSVYPDYSRFGLNSIDHIQFDKKYDNEEDWLTIRANLSIYGHKGETGFFCAFFYDSKKNILYTDNPAYSARANELGVWSIIEIPYEGTKYNEVQLEIPRRIITEATSDGTIYVVLGTQDQFGNQFFITDYLAIGINL